MKKIMGKVLLILLIFAAVASAAVIGHGYFDYISQSIFEDSTNHLDEIYSQVNRSFGAFVERNWGLLKGWRSYFDSADEESVKSFIDGEQEYWGFSEFYFLSKDETAMTFSGVERSMTLGNRWQSLIKDGEPIMAGENLESGQEVTVFAVPVESGAYLGFEYDAIAVSYNNADLASSLNVDAFSGKARSFVVDSDGSVLLSTLTGGSVFSNYLTYLKAASDISEESLSGLKTDWQIGSKGLLRCKIGDVNQYILYQPVGYQDYILLSAVPESAVSAGFLSIQKMTANVLLTIFLIIGVTVIILILLRSRSQSRRDRTELQYRERMFDVLSNSVEDFFVMLDSQKLSVDYISPNVERLIGIPAADVRKDIRVLERCTVGTDITVSKDKLESIPINENYSREYEYMNLKTGERRWYRMTVYRMEIHKVGKYVIVMSDRTHEKNMNEQLTEALNAARSANEAKSNFLSNMSHDIRTPMNAIVGFSVLLEKDADQPEKVKEYTRKITASSHHLLSLINDVLDMSKIESGKTSLNVDKLSLPGLLEDLNIIIMPQAKAKNHDFRISVKGTPPEQIIGNRLRLNQILINLLSNAVKYTPQGGKIEFSVSELPSPAAQYTKLRFTVTDNGIGMSEEFQKKVFAPFSREINSVTNSIQGTGLGMAITKNLVDLMGGIITLKSEPGKGSTFNVELSFALPEPEEKEDWYRQKVSRMLVADDEEDICLNIRELMRDTGVDVSIATDGMTAVDKAVKAHNSGEGFNVILLDWKMPGTDGVETAKLIREKIGKDVPILVLTSYDWSEIEAEARDAGINAFMPKPFFASTFWQTIKPLFTETPEAEKPAEPEISVLRGRHFLIVEDNELNAEILTEMLEIDGATSELAKNGAEAVEMFKAAAPGRYDMIFMDVQMPVMNGYEATKAIRACGLPRAKDIPIAAMTANTFAEDVRNALDAGMDGHLAKPVNMNAVRELAAKLLKPKTEGEKTDEV